MKGVSKTLWIVVSAVVIIVVALVVLTIFATNIQNVASIGQVDALCHNICQTACGGATSGTGFVASWHVPMYKVTGSNKVYSCAERIPQGCLCGSETG